MISTIKADLDSYLSYPKLPDGNREIKLSLSNGFVNILYRDLSTLQSIEEERKEKILDEAIKTKEDI